MHPIIPKSLSEESKSNEKDRVGGGRGEEVKYVGIKSKSHFPLLSVIIITSKSLRC